LAYWVYAEDSDVGKKGDLMEIEVGPSVRVQQEIQEGASGADKPR